MKCKVIVKEESGEPEPPFLLISLRSFNRGFCFPHLKPTHLSCEDHR